MNETSLSLQGKIAVVVGGTAGIGRAISLGLSDAGAAVIASARNKDKVDSVAAELEAKNCSTMRVTCDIASRASLEDLLWQALQRFGKVDILVNCAAKIRRAPTLTFPEDEWNDILDTNLTGTLRSCQIFGRYMLERKYCEWASDKERAHSEDARFFQHRGFDVVETGVVIEKAVEEGHRGRGASTITQQLAKNLWLGEERSLLRKAREYFLARRLETLGKDRILELYLNKVYFGPAGLS